jgi:hypothetical protein
MSITPYVPPNFLTGLPTAIWSGVDSLAVLPFLPGQAISVTKAPVWSTQVILSANGRRRTTAYYPFPLWQFELQYEVLRLRSMKDGAGNLNIELQVLWEFFNVAKGQFGSWLFVDPSDCIVPTAVLQDPATLNPLTDPTGGAFLTDPASTAGFGYRFGTGDGSTRTFQLNRFFNSFSEPVFAAFNPTIVDNGAPAGTNVVANGQVTFTVAPVAGHALTWFGAYYFGCAFSQDDLSFEQLVYLLWSGKSLKFESLRV